MYLSKTWTIVAARLFFQDKRIVFRLWGAEEVGYFLCVVRKRMRSYVTAWFLWLVLCRPMVLDDVPLVEGRPSDAHTSSYVVFFTEWIDIWRYGGGDYRTLGGIWWVSCHLPILGIQLPQPNLCLLNFLLDVIGSLSLLYLIHIFAGILLDLLVLQIGALVRHSERICWRSLQMLEQVIQHNVLPFLLLGHVVEFISKVDHLIFNQSYVLIVLVLQLDI